MSTPTPPSDRYTPDGVDRYVLAEKIDKQEHDPEWIKECEELEARHEKVLATLTSR
jgi:hypothetical protein